MSKSQAMKSRKDAAFDEITALISTISTVALREPNYARAIAMTARISLDNPQLLGR